MGLGARIIEGLKQAQRGDLARVTIEGKTWARLDRITETIRNHPGLTDDEKRIVIMTINRA